MDKQDTQLAVADLVLLALWGTAIAMPMVLAAKIGFWYGAGAGVMIPVVWIGTVPSTCQSGGLGASCLGMGQVASGLGWLIAALVAGVAKLLAMMV